MPVGINQPSNQIKLTNVSLVRMKKGVNQTPQNICYFCANIY
jgi:hypothetical protein